MHNEFEQAFKKWVLGHPQGVSLLKIDFGLPLLLQSFQLQVLNIETNMHSINLEKFEF
jgi:hypothetical protein